MEKVFIEKEMFDWAISRSKRETIELYRLFKKLDEWISGEDAPTFKQLEDFAKATYVPIGYLFLDKPPTESIPIPDFRTVKSKKIDGISPNLREVIYSCQERQEWLRDYLISEGQKKLNFVGKYSTNSSIELAAKDIANTLNYNLDERKACLTWEDALRLLISKSSKSGITVMISGIVGSNTRRVLSTSEFRGFCLSDNLAPLIFINGTDYKSAQMFTVAHEISHIWLGETAISNFTNIENSKKEEIWCNKVAAELLAPKSIVLSEYKKHDSIENNISYISRLFKVSTYVTLIRFLDCDLISSHEFNYYLSLENDKYKNSKNKSSGGNFYKTSISRLGKNFASAVIESTLEGQTLFSDAYRMLGIKSNNAFQGLGREVGIIL